MRTAVDLKDMLDYNSLGDSSDYEIRVYVYSHPQSSLFMRSMHMGKEHVKLRIHMYHEPVGTRVTRVYECAKWIRLGGSPSGGVRSGEVGSSSFTRLAHFSHVL